MKTIGNKAPSKVFRIAAMLLAVSFVSDRPAQALPQQGNVVAGASVVSRPDAATMHVNQNTGKSIIDWQSYSIGAGEKVRYFQPDSSSISLNRVVGVDPSAIFGQLSANGQVWVVNPNGLLVGPGAKIQVGSFLGATLGLSNDDFMSHNFRFINAQNSLSTITNQGSITAMDGGYVVLISPSITNDGTVQSELGKTYFAVGDEVTIDFAGGGLVGFTIDKAAAEESLGITNLGRISANGGQAILSAKAAGDLFKTVINNEGIIEARTIDNKSGVIRLLGGMDRNSIKVGGTLDVSAPNGGDGGFVETSAAKVEIADDVVVTIQAPHGTTGTWLVDPNASLGKPMTASGYWHLESIPEYAVDGNEATRWADDSFVGWLIVDLLDVYNVDSIELVGIVSGSPQWAGTKLFYRLLYKVEESDPWVEIGTGILTEQNDPYETWNLNSVQMRYVKYDAGGVYYDRTHWAHLSEIRVFGTTPPAPDPLPNDTPAKTPPNAESVSAYQEWLRTGDSGDTGAQFSTAAVQAQRILDNLTNNSSILTTDQRDEYYATLRVELQGLTPSQAVDIALGTDWSNTRQIADAKVWIQKNIGDLKTELTDAKGLYKAHLESQLEKFTKAGDNLQAMLQASQLHDAVRAAYYENRSLTTEQLSALQQASPDLRKQVADAIRREGDTFEAKDFQDAYNRLAQSVEDGTLDQLADRLAEIEAKRIENRDKQLAQMFENAGKDAESAQRLEQALKRQQQLLFIQGQLPTLQNFADSSSEGNRFVKESGTRLRELTREMQTIYYRMESDHYTLEDQARFDTLTFKATALLDTAYKAGASLSAEKGENMKFWQNVAETTRDVSLDSLEVLAALASGGTSAAAATAVSAGTAGLTTFIDSVFVKKDDAYIAAFNTIIKTTVDTIPGGSGFKGKVAENFSKSLISGYTSVMTAVSKGQMSPKQAREHFIDKIASTFGKATVGTFVGTGAKTFDSDVARAAINESAGKFYDMMDGQR